MSKSKEFWEHEDVAETFMLETEIVPNQSFFVGPDLGRPELQLEAQDSVLRFAGMERIELPSIEGLIGSMDQGDLLNVIRRRRSRSKFSGDAVGLSELAAICWAGSGMTGELRIAGREVKLRTLPSAGARYPCNLHFVARSVSELKSGIYYYDPLLHCAVQHKGGIPDSLFTKIFFAQDVATSCSAMFVITISLSRARHKYGERGFRYALLEAGHMGQNIILAAEYFGLSACGIGGYCDATLHEECGITKNTERIVYPIGLGVAR